MEQKFQRVSCTRYVPVTSLVVDHRYQILGAERAVTRFGPTVMLRMVGTDNTAIKMYLPRHYAAVFTDDDVEKINSGTYAYDLVSKGMRRGWVTLKLETRQT